MKQIADHATLVRLLQQSESGTKHEHIDQAIWLIVKGVFAELGQPKSLSDLVLQRYKLLVFSESASTAGLTWLMHAEHSPTEAADSIPFHSTKIRQEHISLRMSNDFHMIPTIMTILLCRQHA